MLLSLIVIFFFIGFCGDLNVKVVNVLVELCVFKGCVVMLVVFLEDEEIVVVLSRRSVLVVSIVVLLFGVFLGGSDGNDVVLVDEIIFSWE